MKIKIWFIKIYLWKIFTFWTFKFDFQLFLWNPRNWCTTDNNEIQCTFILCLDIWKYYIILLCMWNQHIIKHQIRNSWNIYHDVNVFENFKFFLTFVTRNAFNIWHFTFIDFYLQCIPFIWTLLENDQNIWIIKIWVFMKILFSLFSLHMATTSACSNILFF